MRRHTDLRSSNEIVKQILAVSVTKNLQLKSIPDQLRGQEEVSESCRDFVLFLKSFPQIINVTAVNRGSTSPR